MLLDSCINIIICDGNSEVVYRTIFTHNINSAQQQLITALKVLKIYVESSRIREELFII